MTQGGIDAAALNDAIAGCLARLAAGDPRAREDILEVCMARLHVIASRMLADFPVVRRWNDTGDILQGGLVRLHRALADVQPTTPRDLLALATTALAADPPAASIALKNAPDGSGTIEFQTADKTALAFNFGRDVDIPHFFPVNSPSGKSMTVQRTEPYPHHRSFWFADTVQLKGQRRASFYNAWYTRTQTNATTGPFSESAG